MGFHRSAKRTSISEFTESEQFALQRNKKNVIGGSQLLRTTNNNFTINNTEQQLHSNIST